MKKIISLSFLALLSLSACGASQAENAGKAMAEIACLMSNESADKEAAEEVIKKYGFETAADIDTYLETIKGTEKVNTVVASARDTLTEVCGDWLEQKGVDPSVLSKAMVGQGE